MHVDQVVRFSLFVINISLTIEPIEFAIIKKLHIGPRMFKGDFYVPSLPLHLELLDSRGAATSYIKKIFN